MGDMEILFFFKFKKNFSDGGNREFGEMRTPPGWMAANCHKNHRLVVLKGEKESFFKERRKKRSGRKEEFFIAFVRRKITCVHRSFKGFADKLNAEQLECRLPGMFFEILLLLLTFYSSLFSGYFQEFILVVWCGR